MIMASNTHTRVFALSPHPDDVAIGIGGLLNRLAARTDIRTTVIQIAFAESSSRGQQEAAYCATRGFEAVFLGLGTDSHSYVHGLQPATVYRALRSIVTDADLLLAPHDRESHPDHVAVALAAARLDAPTAYYEVWSPLNLPEAGYAAATAAVALSPAEHEDKLAGIRMFGTDNDFAFFSQLVHNLTNYRWVSLSMYLRATAQITRLPPMCRHIELLRIRQVTSRRVLELFDYLAEDRV
jgi:LmbE family N-acetylglucosaminyl deacetylase